MRKGSSGMPLRGKEIRKEPKSLKIKKSPPKSRSEERNWEVTDVPESVEMSQNELYNGGSRSRKACASNSKTTEDTRVGAADAEENELSMLVNNLYDTNKKTLEGTLQELEKKMSAKFLPDSLEQWTQTISSSLADTINRGETTTASLAAKIAALTCVQLGGLESADVDRMYTKYFHPALLDNLKNKSADSSLRALCAEAIGIGEHIATDAPKIIEETLEELWSLVLNLSGGKGVDISPEAATVCAAALRSWCLILSGASSVSIMECSIARFSQFQDLLESSSAELRVASGTAMALLCELATRIGSAITPTDELCATFRDLAKDKRVDVKYEQQTTFRDVLKTYQDGTKLNFNRKLCAETLYIESWAEKIQYDAFFRILHDGMDFHLRDNVLLRSKFHLGSPVLNMEPTKGKRSIYAAAFKERTKDMSRLRDKRTESYEDESLGYDSTMSKKPEEEKN